MGKNKKILVELILAAFFILFTFFLIKCLYDFFDNLDREIDEYYASVSHAGVSGSIEESKEKGAFLWEYNVDSIISADTFILRPAYAFAEHIWLHNSKNPDSIYIHDSIIWQAVIMIPQLNKIPGYYNVYNTPSLLWDLQAHNWQSQDYGDSTIAFVFGNHVKHVPPKDTLKYYFLYKYYDDRNHLRKPDTLTLYLTRKYEIEE